MTDINKKKQPYRNEPKPLLCKVAVVTPKFRDFMNWVDINQKEGETYACVNRIDNVWGRRFNRIEKLYNYQEIKDIDDIMEYLEMRIVSNQA